ncbi:MAG: hypothetical protein R8L58_04325 [Mariprofundaceae bacterium]
MADEPSIEEILASLDQLLEDSGIGNDDARAAVPAAKQKEERPPPEGEDLSLDALFAETTNAELEISGPVEQAAVDARPEPEAPADIDAQAPVAEPAHACSEPLEGDAHPIIDSVGDAAGQPTVSQPTASQTTTAQEGDPLSHPLVADLAAAVLDFNRGASAPEITPAEHQPAAGADEPVRGDNEVPVGPEDDGSQALHPTHQTSHPDGGGEIEDEAGSAAEAALLAAAEEASPDESHAGEAESGAPEDMVDEAAAGDADPDEIPSDEMPSDEMIAGDDTEAEAQGSDADAEAAEVEGEEPAMEEPALDESAMAEAPEEAALPAGEAEEAQAGPRVVHLSAAEAVPTHTPDLFSSDAAIPNASSAEDVAKPQPEAATVDSETHGVVILTEDMMVDDHQNALPFDQHPEPLPTAQGMDAREPDVEDEKALADQALPDSMPPAWEEAISERVARRIEDVLPALVEASVKKALKKAGKRGKRKTRRD